MPTDYVKKIKKYAVISFVIPLITINLCLGLYKIIGNLNIDAFPNLNWDKAEHNYDIKDYLFITNDFKSYTLSNCPKNSHQVIYINTNNEEFSGDATENSKIIETLIKNNKTKIKIKEEKNTQNNRCIKNNEKLYLLTKRFEWFDKVLLYTLRNNSQFSKVKNPYFYGEVSISRTARNFPGVWIFKPFIILSAFTLFLYWRNNLNLLNDLKNKNILEKFSKKFFYLGLLSCIFLTLHAAFLGLDFDSKLFSKLRRLIIILFILSEIAAQILLTKSLYFFKRKIRDYINPIILNIKVFFVIIVFLGSIISFLILGLGNPSTAFKHILEWNYFSFLLLYYFLSRLLWK